MHREPHTAWSSDAAEPVGVLGATSFVGQSVLSRLQAAHLRDADQAVANRPVFAFSRSDVAMAAANASEGVHWHRLPAGPEIDTEPLLPSPIPRWIAVCPIWAVAAQLPLLAAAGAKRIVVLSSTSRLTKRDSAAAEERALAARLAAAEQDLLDQARDLRISATILRPTMIYDGIHDRNVMAIADFIRRYGFFPVAGAAAGLRQPVHADDVAAAAVAALARDGLCDTYTLSGGETLTYRDMVRRIFAWLGQPLRLATVPIWLVRAAGPLVGRLPGLGRLAAMANRMNEDHIFDHGAATRDIGFQPRAFSLPLRGSSNHHAASFLHKP